MPTIVDRYTDNVFGCRCTKCSKVEVCKHHVSTVDVFGCSHVDNYCDGCFAANYPGGVQSRLAKRYDVRAEKSWDGPGARRL